MRTNHPARHDVDAAGIETCGSAALQEISGRIKSYDWGSLTAIANLTGRNLDDVDKPEAELWLGAHMHGSATLSNGIELRTAIDRDPQSYLGQFCRSKFGDGLPFLLKFLAASKPLSIQAHPNRKQAIEGFSRENRIGVPIDSPQRNYKDCSHKPELVVAVSDFEALAGFREPTSILRCLDALGYSTRSDLYAWCQAQNLKNYYGQLLDLDEPALADLVQDLIRRCHSYLKSSRAKDEFVRESRNIIRINKTNPNDKGVLAALVMNHVTLKPGQGLYIGPGILHAYLQGTAVEVMATSDNVLRGGLTSKHVDNQELMRIGRFEHTQPILVQPRPVVNDARTQGFCEYQTPVDDFHLRYAKFAGSSSRKEAAISFSQGPQIVFCVEGAVQISSRTGSEPLSLNQGQAAWVPPGHDFTARSQTGPASIYVATTP